MEYRKMKNHRIKKTNQGFDSPHAGVKLGGVLAGVRWFRCLFVALSIWFVLFVGSNVAVGYLDYRGYVMPWMITCHVVQ
jgi:hypothetical protein